MIKTSLIELCEQLGIRMDMIDDVSILAEPVEVGGLVVPNSLAVHLALIVLRILSRLWNYLRKAAGHEVRILSLSKMAGQYILILLTGPLVRL